MRLFILGLLIVAFLPLTAAADDQLVPVPQEMQQRWISRDCETGKMAYRFSKHFLLTSIYSGSKILRIGGLIDHGEGRYSLSNNSAEKTGYIMGTQGDLLQYLGDSGISFSAAALENKTVEIPYITFKNCSYDVPMVVQENKSLVSLMPRLDNIHEACPTQQDINSNPACQETVFRLFDDSGDGALDKAEMKWAWDFILPRSFSSCGPAPMTAGQLHSDSAAYIEWIGGHLDQNKDEKISFSEIEGQWDVLQADPLMSGLTNILISAEKPLAILPEDIKVTCVNCCIATGKLP